MKNRLFWQTLLIPANILLLCLMFVYSLTHGAASIELDAIIEYITNNLQQPNLQAAVLFDIRFPRTVLAMLVGAGLAASGAALQALFRNPLADPGLLGFASGGALGAITVIVLGHAWLVSSFQWLTLYLVPLGAMLGCIIVSSLVYQLSKRHGQITIITLLLAGIAINAIVGSVIGLLTLVSDDSELRELTFWTMGNIGGNSWKLSLPVMLFIGISLIGLVRLTRPLNIYLLGESQAFHLGVSVSALKKQTFFFTALAVGSAVSITGIIGFVGLVIPHLIRLVVGPDLRLLLPASMLLGASLLTLADTMARTLIIPAELPIGLLTGAIGGPFFLAILYRQSSQPRV